MYSKVDAVKAACGVNLCNLIIAPLSDFYFIFDKAILSDIIPDSSRHSLRRTNHSTQYILESSSYIIYITQLYRLVELQMWCGLLDASL